MTAGLLRRPSAPQVPARFRDLLAAEWIKLWSLRSTWGSLALILLSTVGLSVHATLATYADWARWSAEQRALLNPLWDAFPQQAQMFVVLAAGSVGAIAVGGEYATGLLRTTFAAVPARRAVTGAKIIVVAGVMTVLGLLGAATAFGVSQAILSARHAGMSVGEPGALRGILASGLLVPVCALAGMGFAALVRHTAPAIVAAAAALLLLPTAVDEDERWTALLRHAMPVPAWQRLIEISEPPPWITIAHPATISGAWTTYAAWAAISALVTVLAVHRRDP
ncbi:ABC transporter permease [Micromonospora phytophila]|uniref:ABC transporter permease n=1 Tax=Micromonospora phytophila TaxID=709888 RepID=UPI00202E2B8A|nr:ABC transporter permease [Micromonospora phytophila]MCM0676403.1 ABC transporter permease [Micromonospora phytophila]